MNVKRVYWRVIEALKARGGAKKPSDPPGIFPLRPMPHPVVDESNHPEALALVRFCQGKGIDVGCGHRKVTPECIGVDIMAKGQKGEYGVVANQVSEADIQASGDDLHMFGDGELDFVVSRHNLEHYIDVVKTLLEWRRVLRPGGTMAIIVPDERAGDTLYLDPTHKHCFTPDSLRRLLTVVRGFDVVRTEIVVRDWSFLLVATKR
jgi:ubiquinone/menaquinone biosynthesis C-methylase UbiE